MGSRAKSCECSAPASARRQNVLYLVHRVPYPPDRGDRIRSYHILKFLAERYNVYLATLADEPLPADHAKALKKLCVEVAIERLGPTRWLRAAGSLLRGGTATEGLFRSAPLARTIRNWSRAIAFDATVVVCSSMAPYLAESMLSEKRVVVDLIDVDSQKWLDYAELSSGIKRQLFLLEGRRLRRLEQTLATTASAITLVSEAEAMLFRAACPNQRTHAVANGVDFEYFNPSQFSLPARTNKDGRSAVAPLDLVFVGALDYRANVDGVTWFCESVWPRIRQQYPAITLGLVGRNPVSQIQDLAGLPGVQVIGAVPDVRPYLASAKIAIAPLRIARGIQNKVLEALAMGKCVVASTEALEGLDVEPGKDIVGAATAEEWFAALSSLLDDSVRRTELGLRGRAFVEREHCWATCLAPLSELLGVSNCHELAVSP